MFGLLRQSRLLIVPILAIDYLCHQMPCSHWKPAVGGGEQSGAAPE